MTPPADRACRRHHAMEHAFHAVDLKIAPALAAGCTVVHKPAELSPITASILMEIAEEAGLRPASGTSSTVW